MRSWSEGRARVPASVVALTLFLAACGQVPRPQAGHRPPPQTQAGNPSDSRPGPVVRQPASDTPVKIGRPYQVAGVWYTPADETGYDEVGYASWYGDAFHGASTANGERFDMDTVSAAHKTLPLPSYVEVTALDTGRTLLVRVNDRGPFVANRIIDLSRRSAEMLGIARKGVARVRVRRVQPNETDRLALRKGEPAAERPYVAQSELAALDTRFRSWLAAQQEEQARLERVRQEQQRQAAAMAAPAVTAAQPSVQVSAASLAPYPTPTSGGGLSAASIGGWFVQVGAYGDRVRADGLAAALGATIESVGNIHRVRIGPYFDETIALAALARVQRDGYGEARLIRPRAEN